VWLLCKYGARSNAPPRCRVSTQFPKKIKKMPHFLQPRQLIFFLQVHQISSLLSRIHPCSKIVVSILAYGSSDFDLLLRATANRSLGPTSHHITSHTQRLQRWIRDKTLSFVPPDGNFTLMDYRVGSALGGGGGSATSQAQPHVIPFTMNKDIEISENGGESPPPIVHPPSSILHSFKSRPPPCLASTEN
jgi:hypothetical protein